MQIARTFNEDDQFPKIFWSSDGRYDWPTMRDIEGAVVQPFTSYLDILLTRAIQIDAPVKATISEVDAAAYALLAFARFLTKKRILLRRFKDSDFKIFCTETLKSVKANPISRGNPGQAKRTANVKIRLVYMFLYWGQEHRRLPSGTIGWLGARVKSSLPEAHTRGHPVDLKAKRMYPLLFHRAGDGSMLNQGQHWATEEEIRKVERWFWATNSYEVAVRNILLLRVAQYTAFRNESNNSLLVTQFTDELTQDRTADVYAITPQKQKNEAGFQLSMDWTLVDRIREYIRDDRPELLRLAKADEGVTKGRVFVSARDGRPLTDRSFGVIMSDAFRAIGAPKGAGGHSLRRYRAVVQCKIIIARMRADGLPPDRQTVVRELMDLLGHSTEDAGRAYDRVMAGYRFSSEESEFWRRSVKAELELDSARSAVAKLLGSLPPELLGQLDLPEVLQTLSPGRQGAAEPS